MAVKPLFHLGRILATPGVLEAVGWEGVLRLVARHVRGDWGDLVEEDRQANERALQTGERIFSSYHVRTPKGQVTIWVITEAVHQGRRASTTVLLPEEY